MNRGNVRLTPSGRWQVRVSAGNALEGGRRVLTATCATFEEAEATRSAFSRAAADAMQAHKLAPALSLPTLPVGPLAAVIEAEFGPAGVWSMLARRVGVSLKTVHRWKASGLPLWSADAAAVALGRHPAAVWGSDWWQVPDLPSDRQG